METPGVIRRVFPPLDLGQTPREDDVSASRASTTRKWKDVDRTEDPADFIRYLDVANAEDVIRAYKSRMRDLLEPLAGARILDAGCGTGDDACAIARLVGPSGAVVGLDTSEAMVAEARQRAAP